MLMSGDKAKQQRGLLLARKFDPPTMLDLLILSIRASQNEWIRATATVGLGQIHGADPTTRNRAIEELLGLLVSDGDYGVRAAAAAGCGYLADAPGPDTAQVVEHLIRGCYEDHEWQVQFSCLVSLGNLRDQRALPVLLEALKSDNDLLVQGAIGALGEIGDASVISAMLECLGSDDMMTRQKLAHALGGFPIGKPEPSVVDALRTLSKDQHMVVRQAAFDSLSTYGLGAPAKPDTLSEEERIDREVFMLFNEESPEDDKTSNDGQSKGDKSSDGSEPEAKKDSPARESAADAMRRRLERSFDKESAPSEPPPSSDGQVAADAPKRTRSPSASPLTSAALSNGRRKIPPRRPGGPTYRTPPTPQHPSPDASASDAPDGNTEASGAGPDDPNASAADAKKIMADLETGDLTKRSLAAVALRNLPPEEAYKIAVDSGATKDRSERIRSMMLPVIAACKKVEHIEEFVRSDPDQFVRATACDALIDAGGGPEAVSTLLVAFEADGHWLVRISAAIALGTIGVDCPQVEDTLIASLAPGGVKGMDPPQDGVVQRHSVTALGLLGSVKALPVLHELAKNAEEPVRFRVAAAVRNIPHQDSVEVAKILAQDVSNAVSELAQGSLDTLKQAGFE